MSQKQCSQTTTSEEGGQPKRESNQGPSAYQTNASPLDQTGTLNRDGSLVQFLLNTT